MFQFVAATIVRLNNLYGYGDVIGVVLNEQSTGGTVIVKRTSCQPETRKFRLKENVVHFARHQLSL